ncbi:MAG: ion channel [Nocardioidaceae bacterium]
MVSEGQGHALGHLVICPAWRCAAVPVHGGYVFVIVQAAEPGSFTAAVDPEQTRSWVELLFLSFTTLSSTGLSDAVPIRPFARSVVMIEQLAGLLYVAMVVARMVGLTFARIGARSHHAEPSEDERR